MVVLIDYFKKWTESRPIKDKSITTVVHFLYKFICRQCCFETQINDQGHEFVNKVNADVHKVIGVEQRIKFA